MNYAFSKTFFELVKDKFEKVYFSDLQKEKNSKYKIVIDYSSCKERMYGGVHVDFIGGEWQFIHKFYDTIRRTCIKDNLEIIIIFDGTFPNNDYEKTVWTYKQSYDYFKSQKLYKAYINWANWLPPTFTDKQIQFEINNLIKFETYNDLNAPESKCLSCFSTYENHVKEVLDYCNKNNIDALLTEDLEMISFLNCLQSNIDSLTAESQLKKIIVCSLKCLKFPFNCHSIYSIKYDVNSILLSFGISIKQFYLFSILIGTRLLSNQDLIPFYKKILHHSNNYVLNEKENKVRSNIISKLLEFVNKYKYETDDELIDYVFEGLKENISYKRKCFKINLDLFKDPKLDLSCYIEEFNGSNHNNDIDFLSLKYLHVNCKISDWFSSLLNKREIYLSMSRDHPDALINSYDLFKQIRENCYFILFSKEEIIGNCNNDDSDKLNSQNDFVTERYFDMHTQKLISNKVILKLTQKDERPENLTKKENQRKMKCFLEIIKSSNKVNKDLVDTIDVRILLPCLVLRYIIEFNHVGLLSSKDLEAFAITFSLVLNQQHRFNYERLNNDIQNMRASFLLELFLKGIEVFYFANCVCGKPFGDENFCLAYFLQGSLFQIFYNKLSKQNDRIQIRICFEIRETIEKILFFLTYDLEKFILDFDKLNLSPSFSLHRSLLEKKTNNFIESKSENNNFIINGPRKLSSGRGILANRRNEIDKQHFRSQTCNPNALPIGTESSLTTKMIRERANSFGSPRPNNRDRNNCNNNQTFKREEPLFRFPEETCLLIERYFYKIELKEMAKKKKIEEKKNSQDSKVLKPALKSLYNHKEVYSLQNPPRRFIRPKDKMVSYYQLPKILFSKEKLEEMKRYLENEQSTSDSDAEDEA